MARNVRDILADMVQNYASTAPLPTTIGSSNIAKNILSFGSPGVKPFDTQREIEGITNQGPAFITRVLDVMSRPLYASANYVENIIENYEETQETGRSGWASVADIIQETPGAIWEGLSGKDKKDYHDILDQLGVDDGWGKTVAGFGLDVLLDPTTLLGVGLAKNLGRGAVKSIQGLREVENVTGEAATGAARVLSQETPDALRLNPAAAPEGVETLPLEQVSPVSIREALQESLKKEAEAGTAARQAQVRKLLENVPANPINPQQVDRALEGIAASTTNPITRNLVKQTQQKVASGIKPAQELLSPLEKPTPKAAPQAAPLQPKQLEAAREIASKFYIKNKYKEINHAGQSNLFNRINAWVLKNIPPKRRTRQVTTEGEIQGSPAIVYQMLKVAEDELEQRGRKFVDREGNNVRFSQVIEEEEALQRQLNLDDLKDSFRQGNLQSIENVKAVNAVQTAEEVTDPPLSIAQAVAQDIQYLPPSRAASITQEVSRELGKIIDQAGAVKHDAEASKAMIRDLFKFDQDAASESVEAVAKEMARDIVKGRISHEVIDRMNKGVYKTLDANPRVLGKTIDENRAVEAIMTRFATWWGAKDLRPFAREYIDTMKINPSAFKQVWEPVYRSTALSERQSAWRIAQGAAVSTSPQQQQLSTMMRHAMERMFSSDGVKDSAVAGNTVVTRAGVTLDEINAALSKQGSNLRFTDGKGIDDFGNEFDFSEGLDWMNSWEVWDVDDPIDALWQVQNALTKVTKKNSMLDDAAARWGSPVKGGEFQHKLKYADRIRDYYFPKDIAEQLGTTLYRMDKLDQFNPGGKAIQLFDKVQRAWKSGVTIYAPAHHIRNMIGDVYLGMLDGVISVRPYTKAARVMHAMSHEYRDIMKVQDIIDPKYVRQAMTRPGDTVVTSKGGKKFTAEQIFLAAQSRGLLPKAHVLEELVGDPLSRVQPFGGRVQRGAHRLAENRDHFVRLAHFLDIVGKSKTKNVRDLFDEAARRVRKFHPDGLDLTGFEQNVLRRLIPFYSWLRKSTPLVIESLVTRPHIVLAYPKGMQALQEQAGIEGTTIGDPFPEDQLFPEWIREKGIGPVSHPAMGGVFGALSMLGRQESKRGSEPGYTIFNPSNPTLDQLYEIGNPVQALFSGATPALRIPAELGTGRTSLGIPFEYVEPGGAAGHLVQQIPAAGIGARITGLTRPEEDWQPEQLLNYLTAGGIRGTGPMQRSAEFELREYLAQLRREQSGG